MSNKQKKNVNLPQEKPADKNVEERKESTEGMEALARVLEQLIRGIYEERLLGYKNPYKWTLLCREDATSLKPGNC